MGFLKKLGSIALKVTSLAVGFEPLVRASLSSGQDGKAELVFDRLEQVRDIIIQAEVFGQALSLTGANKLEAAAPAVANLILQSTIMSGRKIDNPDLFRHGSKQMAAGMADILNSLKDDIKTEVLG